MRMIPSILVVLLLVLPLSAQQTGDSNRDYVINNNGAGGTSIVSTTVIVSGLMNNDYTTQDPAAPVIWAMSPNANPGQLVVGPNSIDIGTAATGFSDLTFLGNGTAPGVINAFFGTDASGNFSVDLSASASLGGTNLHFAMAHVAASSSAGFWISQTHQVSFLAPAVVVSAEGTNSFNSDVTAGFWKVTNLNDPRSIVQVVFDWTGAPSSQATMEFDTDQSGMSDRFDGGNSTVSGCLGTYRNGSDTATGLIYSGTPAAPCDPAANTGWTGTNAGNATNDWRTITFSFTPGIFTLGQTFELDIDTDGGLGISGDNMVGMQVSVTFDDMSTVSGALAVDPSTPNRSQVAF